MGNCKIENGKLSSCTLAGFSKSFDTFRVFLLFASTLFLGFTNDYFDFSCRTRLKTVELERDRMSHEVTKVVIS